MAITKTNFINYARCQRYVALEQIKKDALKTSLTIEEYKKQENPDKLREIMGNMYQDEDDNDETEDLEEILNAMFDKNSNNLIDIPNPQLEAMLNYYTDVEIEAASYIENKFNQKIIFSTKTLNQKLFDCEINDIMYLCYIDIFMPTNEAFNIFEVKATTSGNFLKMGYKGTSIFEKDENGIYHLKSELGIHDIEQDKYLKQIEKLMNKLSPCGKYVYDLAVQRYIIEQNLKQNGEENQIDKIKYYLVTLNSNYVFNGKYVNSKPYYQKDDKGNEIIDIFDFTEFTKDYMDKINLERQAIEEYIKKMDASEIELGKQCCRKKTNECKYKPVCFSKIPEKNSIFTYLFNHCGFQDEYKNKHETYEMINSGITNMIDVSDHILNRPINQLQKDVVLSHSPYLNKEKMQIAIDAISYPIYHLDFETFNSPLPRFRGEKCYSQSVFQFSLHIEKEAGICDKEKDHYEFLATNHNDQREELVQKLCEYIDVNSGGTILTYNMSFEKTRIKELSNIFPEYRQTLRKMMDMIYDLMFVVKNNKKAYLELGFSDEEASIVNYYHEDLNGSYSIKKVLPIFSELTYKNMPIGNGIDAIVAYSNFPHLSPEEFRIIHHNLLKYCAQDTWAMVEILDKLRQLCQKN